MNVLENIPHHLSHNRAVKQYKFGWISGSQWDHWFVNHHCKRHNWQCLRSVKSLNSVKTHKYCLTCDCTVQTEINRSFCLFLLLCCAIHLFVCCSSKDWICIFVGIKDIFYGHIFFYRIRSSVLATVALRSFFVLAQIQVEKPKWTKRIFVTFVCLKWFAFTALWWRQTIIYELIISVPL